MNRVGLIDNASDVIRAADGNHTMGAGVLAEAVVEALMPHIDEFIREAATDAITLCADEIGETYHFIGYEDAQKVATWLHDMASRDQTCDWTLRYNTLHILDAS